MLKRRPAASSIEQGTRQGASTETARRNAAVSYETRGQRGGGASSSNSVFSRKEKNEDDGTTRVSRPSLDSAAFQELFPLATLADAVLEIVSRAAALSGKMAGDNRAAQGDMSDGEAVTMPGDATEFVPRFVAVSFGAVNTRNTHELAAHLLAHQSGHGNIPDADTSLNVSLLAHWKAKVSRTNTHVATFVMQMRRAEQTMTFTMAGHARDMRDEETARNSSGDAAQCGAPQTSIAGNDGSSSDASGACGPVGEGRSARLS